MPLEDDYFDKLQPADPVGRLLTYSPEIYASFDAACDVLSRNEDLIAFLQVSPLPRTYVGPVFIDDEATFNRLHADWKNGLFMSWYLYGVNYKHVQAKPDHSRSV